MPAPQRRSSSYGIYPGDQIPAIIKRRSRSSITRSISSAICAGFWTVKQGERGLRQSDALFQRIQNLPELMEEMRRMFDGRIDAVACRFRPRPEAGSYMPVFLAGSGFAKAAAAAMNVPGSRFFSSGRTYGGDSGLQSFSDGRSVSGMSFFRRNV